MAGVVAVYFSICRRNANNEGHQAVAPVVPIIPPEVQQARQGRRRQINERIFQTRVNLFHMSPEQIISLCRLDTEANLYLVDLIKGDVEGTSKKTTAITPLVKVLAFLYFCATGSYQGTVAMSAGLSQPAFCKMFNVVLQALLQHMSKFIHFPQTAAELASVKCAFFAIAGFPNVVGAIDCKHVRRVPPCAREKMFRNRKMHYSLNIQMTCSADMQITHCYANFPGSAHDAYILRSSNLPVVMSSMSPDNSWLLGGGAYPLKPWLMTPILNPRIAAKQKYNAAHVKTRNTIERTFGLLKSRFRCLHVSGGDLMYAPEKVCKIIVLCCMLHNLATRH
ncbi:putative nuclease HARBI1 [Ambystoma mexicanum]|uniref:putative nuclease HARBI1 n=1 Tax=Ambystoma mexicanum TaxID=8296 RepID=UPI0037E7DAA5